jgi:hypothetical protein
MTSEGLRSTEGFITLDDFLDAEGVRDAFQAVAITEVLAWQRAAEPLGRKVMLDRL